MNEKFDFTGWATRNDIKCSDGRTIRKDAFIDNDGQTVPLVWNHSHNDHQNVLGHALLENREEGVYVYGTFNNTDSGRNARQLVENGDVTALSIYANQLKQRGGDVIHGAIREVSLVLAGANPGAYIDSVISHGEESDEEAIIYTGEELELSHSESESKEEMPKTKKEEKKMDGKEKTIKDVFDEMTEEQKTVVYAMIGAALEEAGANNEGDETDMKHNVFENDNEENSLMHVDGAAIIDMAKTSSIGSLQEAINIYANENSLQHDAFDDMSQLFPEYELIDPKEPTILWDDDTWFNSVLNGVTKSPIARVRTRKADARQADLRAKGYTKASEKKVMNHIKLLGRTHDAQTVYIKDKLNRDDILDITDFDVVNYQWKIMEHAMKETLATAILVGDGREDLDPDKIKEDHIRPIWHDNDLYCIHQDVDIKSVTAELQGTNTAANFGENYIYAEAIIQASLYAREKYKGSGNLTFYCTPHLLNVMLLARDLNGRRIYSSKADLVAALNVKDIVTIEQFEGLTRTDAKSKTKKLLGLFVNMKDYQLGCVKNGQITRFDQFDIDFNQQKLLLEGRFSGALVEWYSAIALEELVEPSSSSVSEPSES